MAKRGRLLDEAGTRVTPEVDFSDWMRAHQSGLMRTAYLLTGSQPAAEDLVQTVLAKLYLAWERLRDRHQLEAYARKALVNEHRSAWRRAARRPELLTADVPEARVRAGSVDDGERDEVWAFVQGLPPRQRAVIVLRFYEDLSEAQTADLLDISVGTVKSQASRALAALRERVVLEEER